MNDAAFDLNLMRVFAALMRERSVTRAARALGIGQPAASNALARLRAATRDELFVRSGGTMIPTLRAKALSGPIDAALTALREAVAPPETFDPAAARRRFRISAGDYAAMTLLPSLATAVRRSAPEINLRFRFVEKDRLPELLDAGSLDLAIGVFPEAAKRFAVKPLLEESFVCVTHVEHRLPGGAMTLDCYLTLPHVLVTERGDESGAVDTALRASGHVRRIAVTVPHLLLLPALLRDTGLVATIGRRAATLFAADKALEIHPLPIALPPWRLQMMWARQTSGDAGLAWLRDLLTGLAARA